MSQPHPPLHSETMETNKQRARRNYYGNTSGSGNAADQAHYDERFFTPRASASAMSSRSQASVSSEISGSVATTARFYTPRAATYSARSQGSNRSQMSLATARSHLSSSSASANSFRTGRSSFSSPSQYINSRNRPPNPAISHRHADINRRPISALERDMDLEAASTSIHRPASPVHRTNNNQDIFSLARHARVSEVEELLIRGVPIASRDENGNTILSIGCQNGSKRIAKLALRFGADINEQNGSGNTALHYTALYQKDLLGQYLIKKGADTTVRNNEGRLYSEVTR